MAAYPLLKIDLLKIAHNAKLVAGAFAQWGIETIGVVKGCSGDPWVAKAVLAGGVSAIADSRLSSLRRLRAEGISDLMMLRQPLQGEVGEVVELTSSSLVSDYSILRSLSRAAVRKSIRHEVVLMVETGGLREGMLPEEVLEAVSGAVELEGIRLAGVGTNLGCLAGGEGRIGFLNESQAELQLKKLTEVAGQVSGVLGDMPKVVSGGNSALWKLLSGGRIPPSINQVRVGEAILLGRETLCREPIEGAFQDAFLLESEVMEFRSKPLAITEGSGQRSPLIRRQAVVALGRQDIGAGRVSASRQGFSVLEVSSDHLVLEVREEEVSVGQVLEFIPDYRALAAAAISPFVQKVYVSGKGSDFEPSNISSRKAVIG